MPDIINIRAFLHYDPETGIFTWTKHHEAKAKEIHGEFYNNGELSCQI